MNAIMGERKKYIYDQIVTHQLGRAITMFHAIYHSNEHSIVAFACNAIEHRECTFWYWWTWMCNVWLGYIARTIWLHCSNRIYDAVFRLENREMARRMRQRNWSLPRSTLLDGIFDRIWILESCAALYSWHKKKITIIANTSRMPYFCWAHNISCRHTYSFPIQEPNPNLTSRCELKISDRCHWPE